MTFYAVVFDCAQLHTFAEFGRTDGSADAIAIAIAPGYLVDGPVALSPATWLTTSSQIEARHDAALLGTAEPAILRRWFSRLSDSRRVVGDLQLRPWGASDSPVGNRHGLHWLIGFEGDEAEPATSDSSPISRRP